MATLHIHYRSYCRLTPHTLEGVNAEQAAEIVHHLIAGTEITVTGAANGRTDRIHGVDVQHVDIEL